MEELVKLRQQQQNSNACLQAMEQRLKGTEQKQQQALSFLARAIRSPVFLQQMVQQKERKEIEEVIKEKRRKKIDHVERESDHDHHDGDHGYICGFGGVAVERLGPFVCGDNIGVKVEAQDFDELERVAMRFPAYSLVSSEGHVRPPPTKCVDQEWLHGGAEKNLGQGRFWEGLMNCDGYGLEGVLDDILG